jgi:hypothetical protein
MGRPRIIPPVTHEGHFATAEALGNLADLAGHRRGVMGVAGEDLNG